MSCSTVEEHAYMKQVEKGSILKSATEEVDPTRYFYGKRVMNIFKVPEDYQKSSTLGKMSEMHDSMHFDTMRDGWLKEHTKHLMNKCGVVGLSRHDLLFSKPQLLLPVPDAELLSMTAKSRKEKSKETMDSREARGAVGWAAHATAVGKKKLSGAPRDNKEKANAESGEPSEVDDKKVNHGGQSQLDRRKGGGLR